MHFNPVRTLALSIVTAATLPICLFGANGTAHAQSKARDGVTVVTVPMTVDCANMPAKARPYATAHGYCRFGNSGSVYSEAVQPNGAAGGNCGTAALTVSNDTHGQAQFHVKLHSAAGNMITVFDQIVWNNSTAPDTSSYGKVHAPIFTSDFTDDPVIGTQAGSVSGQLTGSAELWWSATCDVGPVNSNTTTVTD